MNEQEPPIAALATALAPSAISVIRCSGTGTIELVAGLFDAPERLTGSEGNTIHRGMLSTPSGEPVDEVMVAVFRAPGSYTGEDSAEISGHGSPAGVRRILEALYQGGFRPAAPGEFTRRAFLNGKLDLTRAEAINDLVRSQTREAHRLALDRLNGSVQSEVERIRADLILLMAQLAIQLDYPEEDTEGDAGAALDSGLLENCEARTRELAATFHRGRLVQEGVSVALAGRTNAGKSSLFNAMLRQDRSIVSDMPGTTRDYLEATVDIGGMPVRLFDTAGLRPTGEPVEEEGIRRTRTVLAAADLVLYVLDGTEGVSADDEARIGEIETHTPVVRVWNKTDLPGLTPQPDCTAVSALTGAGLETLDRRIADEVSGDASAGHRRSGAPMGAVHASGVIIDSVRQHDLLRRAMEAMAHTRESAAAGMPADVLAVDLQDAINAIGEITGEVATDEILDAMFGSFCVGK